MNAAGRPSRREQNREQAYARLPPDERERVERIDELWEILQGKLSPSKRKIFLAEYQQLQRDQDAAHPERKLAEQEDRIAWEVGEQDIRDEARRRRAARNWTPPEVIDGNKLALRRPDWLLHGYVPRGTVGLLVGAYGTAKTFTGLDWGACIAAGRSWFGHQTRQGNTMFVAAEGGQSMGNRRTAWVQQNGVLEDEALLFILKPVPLDNPAAVAWLREQVIYYETDFLAIDTIARNKGGLIENDEQDIGRLIEVMFEMRDARGDNMTTVLGLHHTGKDESRGARGSSRLGGDVDFIHKLTKGDDGKPFVLRGDKMKEAAMPAPWSFSLRTVEVEPATAREEAITSCVIEPAGVVVSCRVLPALGPTGRMSAPPSVTRR